MSEDAISKKILVTKWNNFKMIDYKLVMEQFLEIKKLLNHFKQYDMKVDDSITASSITDKLPHSWKDPKKVLKHKRKILFLRILQTI